MAGDLDVLVVDDDPGVARLLVTALRREGWAVEPAADAEQALELLQRLRPTVVLADRSLPGRGGAELARAAEAAGHRAPFLLMSGGMADELRAELLDEPTVAGLLDKPFELERLLADVRALLALAERAAGAVSPAECAVTEPGRSSSVGVAGVGGPAAGTAPRAWFPGATGGGLPRLGASPCTDRAGGDLTPDASVDRPPGRS